MYLEIKIYKSLKIVTQVNRTITKANPVLGFISRGVELKSREVMLNLYGTLVIPALCNTGHPFIKKDREILQMGQNY